MHGQAFVAKVIQFPLCYNFATSSTEELDFTFLYPSDWKDYELIDSGGFEKLERFGAYILIRPEPQALWQRALGENEWKRLAHASFKREQKDKYRFNDDVKGGWTRLRSMPETWNIHYQYGDLKLQLRLALTNFGHVGIFPEQGCNWNFIHDTLQGWQVRAPQILNLFAYTGAASLVARASNADVVHCDASRPGLNWARHNMELNELSDIRWVYEDAFKFVRREVKRGKRYHGIIMDPPPYGRGPQGEKWTLPEQLDELVGLCANLLEENSAFFIMSLYAAGLSPLVSRNVVSSHFGQSALNAGELYLKSKNNKDLPMGTYIRFTR